LGGGGAADKERKGVRHRGRGGLGKRAFDKQILTTTRNRNGGKKRGRPAEDQAGGLIGRKRSEFPRKRRGESNGGRYMEGNVPKG